MPPRKDNLSVLITRPEPGASSLASALIPLGLKPIIAPMLKIRALETLRQPKSFEQGHADALIFISVPAVQFGIPGLQEFALARKRIFAVGPSTAAKIRDMSGEQETLDLTLPTEGFNSEALLRLDGLQRPSVVGKKILIVRGRGGREHLADELRRRGAEVEYFEVYERVPTSTPLREILAASGVSAPSIGVVTSVEGLQQLGERIVTESLTQLFAMPILASGARVAREVPTLGFTNPPLIADNPTQEHIIASLKRWAMEKL